MLLASLVVLRRIGPGAPPTHTIIPMAIMMVLEVVVHLVRQQRQ